MIGSVNGLDITLGVVMGYFLIRGILHGVVKELFGIIALIAAFILASKYWPIGAEHLKAITPNKGHGAVISFFIIYLVVYFLISIAGIFVHKLVRLGISPLASSSLGAVVGLFKGAALCALALLCATVFISPQTDFFLKSQAWPYVEPLSLQVKAYIPTDLRVLMDVKLPVMAQQFTGGLKQGETANNEPAPLKLNPKDIDWSRVREILKEEPHLIAPKWVERFSSLESETDLSAQDIKNFIADNPGLFEEPPATPNPAPGGTDQSPPSWPQPAGS